jgi:hypothetical protein
MYLLKSSKSAKWKIGRCVAIESNGKRNLSCDLPFHGFATISYSKKVEEKSNSYDLQKCITGRLHGQSMMVQEIVQAASKDGFLELSKEQAELVSAVPSPAKADPSESAQSESDLSSEDVKEESDRLPKGYFSVERIEEKRLNKDTGQIEFKVKWRDYARTTWEPFLTLREDVHEMVVEFEATAKAENILLSRRIMPSRRVKETDARVSYLEAKRNTE